MVSRCVCTGVSLAKIRRLCGNDASKINGVCRSTGCGRSCGLCLPYIKAAVALGRDELGVMTGDEFRAIGIEPRRLARLEAELQDGDD